MRLPVYCLALLGGLSLTSPALAADLPKDFSALDKNSDGRVIFSEYQTFAKAKGVSATEAAQDFVRAAQGDAVLTEDELNLALMVEGQAYALKPKNTPKAAIPLGPQPLSEVQDVNEEPIFAYEAIPVD